MSGTHSWPVIGSLRRHTSLLPWCFGLNVWREVGEICVRCCCINRLVTHFYISLQAVDREIWWQSELDRNTWRGLKTQNGTPTQNVMRICWSTDCQDDCWSRHTTLGFGENGEVKPSPAVNLLLLVVTKLNLRLSYQQLNQIPSRTQVRFKL